MVGGIPEANWEVIDVMAFHFLSDAGHCEHLACLGEHLQAATLFVVALYRDCHAIAQKSLRLLRFCVRNKRMPTKILTCTGSTLAPVGPLWSASKLLGSVSQSPGRTARGSLWRCSNMTVMVRSFNSMAALRVQVTMTVLSCLRKRLSTS